MLHFNHSQPPLPVNGQEALFPSSYVEKVNLYPELQQSERNIAPPYNEKSEKPVYRPFGAALHGTDIPPSSGSEVNSVGLQQAPGQEQKKDKFGKYKSTVRISFCGKIKWGLILLAVNVDSWLIRQLEV